MTMKNTKSLLRYIAVVSSDLSSSLAHLHNRYRSLPCNLDLRSFLAHNPFHCHLDSGQGDRAEAKPSSNQTSLSLQRLWHGAELSTLGQAVPEVMLGPASCSCPGTAKHTDPDPAQRCAASYLQYHRSGLARDHQGTC